MKKLAFWLQPIRCIIFILTFSVLAFAAKTDVNALGKWWSIIAICVNLLIITLLYFICKKMNITYMDLIGYKKKSTKVWSIVMMSFLILVVGMGGMYFAGFICYGKFPFMATMMIQPIPIIFAVLNIFLLPITTTLAEDGLYLGLGVNQIKNKGIAIFWQVSVKQ